MRGQYEEGLHEGLWYFYHDDGTLDRLQEFSRGRLVKKRVAINVSGEDILLNTDSIAYMHTNGRIVEIKMIDGETTYRPSQNFDRLLPSIGTDHFFLATPRFLASFAAYESMELLPLDEDEIAEIRNKMDDDHTGRWTDRPPQKAVLNLKIPTPYPVIIDDEVIGLLRSVTNPNTLPPQQQ
jgi:hypothetical protein